jgi:hypothetical protein
MMIIELLRKADDIANKLAAAGADDCDLVNSEQMVKRMFFWVLITHPRRSFMKNFWSQNTKGKTANATLNILINRGWINKDINRNKGSSWLLTPGVKLIEEINKLGEV